MESLIGPFWTSPLGTVPKANGSGYRIIQDLSFPHNNSMVASVNSRICAGDFPCDWGTFADCMLAVATAPSGVQAAVFDVEAAYRCIPICAEDKPHVVVAWAGMAYIDNNLAFGCASSAGVFGRVADVIVEAFRAHGIDVVIKWVDNFVFF